MAVATAAGPIQPRPVAGPIQPRPAAVEEEGEAIAAVAPVGPTAEAIAAVVPRAAVVAVAVPKGNPEPVLVSVSARCTSVAIKGTQQRVAARG